MKIILVFLFLIVYLFSYTDHVIAVENKPFVTIIHPIRGRDLWQNIELLSKQIVTVIDYGFPATWLVQYRVLGDQVVVDKLLKLPKSHEMGIFLEVDEKLADDSLVPYLFGDGDWARADKVLLSGYEPLERKRMIDLVFNKFYNTFGHYPVSVGAWYIDTFSLNYLVKKYKIQTVLEVADQYQTDTYGLWGKPWGVPYFPSVTNSLVPAGNKDRLGVVKIQWAARDPFRGYGLGITDSTYSVQANDYVGHHKLDISYFEKLVNDYLFSLNPMTQLTVGIEVGQEGGKYQDEYRRQIKYLYDLQKKDKITVLTMKDFSGMFKKEFADDSPNYFINGKDIYDNSIESYWYSTNYYRIGFVLEGKILKIRDFRIYDQNIVEKDVFNKDTDKKLLRLAPAIIDDLLLNNAKTLAQNIAKEEIKKDDNKGISIIFTDDNDSRHILELKQKQVFLDGKLILEIIESISLKEKIIHALGSLLVRYQLFLDSNWQGDIRFSSVNNAHYAGFWFKPNKLIGIKSTWPFAGIFGFPYQVLARFKTVEKPGLFSFVREYFINHLNHSTIKAVSAL